MILYAAPTKSLRTIASDSDIALPHVSFFLEIYGIIIMVHKKKNNCVIRSLLKKWYVKLDNFHKQSTLAFVLIL